MKVWKQEFPGQLTTLDGRFEAVRFTLKEGASFSGWIVRSTTNRNLYSDPISNKQDAIFALEEMHYRNK